MFLLRIKLLLRCSFFSGQMLENFPSLCEWQKCMFCVYLEWNLVKMTHKSTICVYLEWNLLKMTRKTYILCFLAENECIYSENCSKIPPKNAPQCLFWATFNENAFKMTHKSTFMCILSEKQTKWHILCVFWVKRCVFTWNRWVSVHFLTFYVKNDETLTL